ncbi:MAG: TatD family hydrolase [Bacteroidales bacterium]|nr:TatD family hydrolase [Bacteroidales bacterium]
MNLIDTHTHIYLPEFDEDRDEVIKRALNSGVMKLLMPNIDPDSYPRMISSENRYPGVCIPMIGLHPTSVKKDYRSKLEKIQSLAEERSYCAVGEIGIDLYWDKTHLNEQIMAFREQTEYALSKNLPVVIHVRESFGELFSALEEFRGSGLKGVFHAFTGNLEQAEKAIMMEFKLGIGGIVTFKNSGLDRIVKEAGVKNIVLETDSPYLAPSPFRGKRNESSYLCIINKKVAEILGMSEEEVASVTYSTSSELFGL